MPKTEPICSRSGQGWWGRARFPTGLLFLLTGMSCACAPRDQSAVQAQPPPVERSLPPPDRELPPRAPSDWGTSTQRTIVLRPQNLVLQLPQAELWQPLARRGTWSGLSHPGTESEIWIRHASARRTITVEECEREARLSWELLRSSGEESLTRPLLAPKGYAGKLAIYLHSDGGGRVEAFTVGVSRCLSVVFVTGGAPGFPERLQVATNEILPTLRVPRISERGLIKPL